MSKKRYCEDIYDDTNENRYDNMYGNSNELNLKRYKTETKYRENNSSTDQIILVIINKMNTYESEIKKLNNNVIEINQEMNQIKKENKKYKHQLHKLCSYIGLNPYVYTETPSYIS